MPQNFSVVAIPLVIVVMFVVFSPLSIARALIYDTTTASNDVRSTVGNYIINYVYEIEVEKPKLSVDKPKVAQGGSITIKGANFANSTVSVQAFDEKLLIFNKKGDKQNQTVGLLLTGSDIALAQSVVGKTAVMKKLAHDDNNSEQTRNGTVTLVIKIPSPEGTQNYSADLKCKGVPDSFHKDPAIIPFGSGTVNGSSRQFVNTSLPVGNYDDCKVIVTLSETSETFRSKPLDFTVIPDMHEKSDGKTAAVVVATNGSFRLRVSLHNSIQPGTYVFMAEEQLGNEDVKHQAAMAIAHVQVLAKQQHDASSTTTTHTRVESFVESSVQSSSSIDTTNSNDDDVSNDHQEPNNSGNNDNNGGSHEEQPPTTTTPPDGGPKEVCTTDDSSFESSNDASYTNTISQTSIQTANNAIINNDTITITQRIIGASSASQNVVTSVDVRSDNEVTQSINQNIVQKAEIEHCHMVGEDSDGIESNGIGGTTNATNIATSAALQEAYNIYSDSDIIQIQQTIIVPKYCNANVYAPITVDDRNRISQSIDQDIVQKSKVKFLADGSASGQGSSADNAAGQYSYLQKNYVTQLSIQGAGNIAFDNNVININQAIIVPASCDADVYAPVVIKSSSDIQLSITQKAEQVSTIKLVGQQYGIMIANAISTGNSSSQANGGSIFTNTIFNYAEQYGENLFIDNDSIEVIQQVFYVNDTTGWMLDNYQDKLAEEFAGSGDDNSTSLTIADNNQTSDDPLQPADDIGGSNNNDTALAEGMETADNASSNDTASDTSASTAATSNTTNTVQQLGVQDAFNYNQDNSTTSVSQDAEGHQIDTTASVHDANDVGQSNEQAQEQDAAVASDGNEISTGDAGSTSTTDNSVEQTGVQLATNYNEENSETTVDQGALGNQVNAAIEVTDESNLAQSDEQEQSQEATVTTGSNSTGT